MIAADLALGLLVGLLFCKHCDEDYAAWRNLKKFHDLVAELGKRTSELNGFDGILELSIALEYCDAEPLALALATKGRVMSLNTAMKFI